LRLLNLSLFLTASLVAAPRLLLNEAKVQELRKQIGLPQSPHHGMYQTLRTQVDATPPGQQRNYDHSYRATSAAFLYQLSGETQYCEIALGSLEAVYSSVTSESLLPEQGYGLARATVGLGFAFAFDWCRDAWPPAARTWVENKLRTAFEAWPQFRHANIETPHRGSNWVSVCRGAELIELIALRREKTDSARYQFLKEDLRLHMQNMDELGVSQEGIGYTAYGGIFLLRALLALRAIGDFDLEAEASKHAWWKQALYSGTFAADANGYKRWLMSGVSGEGIGDEGWASLLFAFTPANDLPHFTWWYDRHIGILAPGPTDKRFDPRREGAVWALLCYPANVTPQDPTGVYPKAIIGKAGLAMFRNRWQDADDILASFHADTTWHSHAWDQPEALQWHLFAYNHLFAGGPDKTRDPANFTTLLVDGRHVADRKSGTTGSLLDFKATPSGGLVVASGNTQYASMGVSVKRTFELTFLDGNQARIRIQDQIEADTTHRYAWQIKAEGTNAAPRLQIRSNTAVLEATVASPTPTQLVASNPTRIELQAASTNFDMQLELKPVSRDKVIELPGGLKLQLRYIPPGSYLRGSPDTETGRDRDEGPQHPVTISRGFYLGTYEITQGQWRAVMRTNPAAFQQGDPAEAAKRPVESVSWHEAQRFLDRLNTLGAGTFRLPTEAEWEYAARAGTTSPYPWQQTPPQDKTHANAWANSRSFATTHPVGQKPPNAWGLFDMHGNVWEWCSDWYGPYSNEAATDPKGPATGRERVFRGGSWYDFPVSLRSANRHRHAPDGTYTAIGLRVALDEVITSSKNTVVLPGGVPMHFTPIPAGSFLMGSPNNESMRQGDEGPQRQVTISSEFRLGTFELTQDQWVAVMGENPSVFRGGSLPVERVSFEDARLFLAKLNAMNLGRFRLPTEAEWEYAARAGSTTRFSFGDDEDYRLLPDHAWFFSRAEGRSHPVGTRKPNPWGLFDMYGNVWEWVEDWFAPYPSRAETDPLGPASGTAKVIRGGSWFNEPEALRAANRNRHALDSRQTNLGLRLVWLPPR
jgi:formylglycine-generating enzyme required for sulfatase activity